MKCKKSFGQYPRLFHDLSLHNRITKFNRFTANAATLYTRLPHKLYFFPRRKLRPLRVTPKLVICDQTDQDVNADFLQCQQKHNAVLFQAVADAAISLLQWQKCFVWQHVHCVLSMSAEMLACKHKACFAPGG